VQDQAKKVQGPAIHTDPAAVAIATQFSNSSDRDPSGCLRSSVSQPGRPL